MINEAYWVEYYSFWDKFVKDWYVKRPDEPSDKVSQAYKSCVHKLDFDELPEPYYGTPEKGVKAVIINLNPGMGGGENEKQKSFREKDEYRGDGPAVKRSLIKEFVDCCNTKYREFAHNWSCLNPQYRQRKKKDLCGVDWWQGVDPSVVGGRVKWLARVYEKELDAAKSIDAGRERGGELNPLEVFALELCPYHSKSFGFNVEKAFGSDDEKKSVLLPFMVERVLQPAFNAVVENSLPFAVAIGKPFAILLEKIGNDGKFGISARLEKEWWDESEDVEDWPITRDKKTGKNRRVYRKYCLFALKDENGRLARFLVCAAPGSNGTPREEFSAKVEAKLILPHVKNKPLTRGLYESLKPELLRWWPRNNANDQPRDEAGKMQVPDRGKKPITKKPKRLITKKEKQQIACLLLDQPNIPRHKGKTGINHSYLCVFHVGGQKIAGLAVKYVDTRGKKPCMAFWCDKKFKKEFRRKLKDCQLPDDFYLDEDHVTEHGSGWVPFCRKGCDSTDEMYRQIVSSGDQRESWISLRDALIKFVKDTLGGEVRFYREEK